MFSYSPVCLGGDHTRTKTLLTSKVGAMAKFTMRRETCIKCKTSLPLNHSKFEEK